MHNPAYKMLTHARIDDHINTCIKLLWTNLCNYNLFCRLSYHTVCLSSDFNTSQWFSKEWSWKGAWLMSKTGTRKSTILFTIHRHIGSILEIWFWPIYTHRCQTFKLCTLCRSDICWCFTRISLVWNCRLHRRHASFDQSVSLVSSKGPDPEAASSSSESLSPPYDATSTAAAAGLAEDLSAGGGGIIFLSSKLPLAWVGKFVEVNILILDKTRITRN